MEQKLTLGTLKQLQTLEKQSTALKQLFQSNLQSFQEVEQLREEIQNLRAKRQKLTSQIGDAERDMNRQLGAALMAATNSVEILENNKGVLVEPTDDNLLKSHKDRANVDLQAAYRLMGRTLVPITKDSTGIRFETCFQGQYYESFYIVLKKKNGEENGEANDAYYVWKHTIPSFVPLDKLQLDYLNKNLEKFCDIVDDYLQAYVNRREQLHQLTDRYSSEILNVTSTTAYNYVQIEIKPTESKDQFKVFLIYDNLLDVFPTRSTIHQLVGKKPRRLIGREHYFKKEQLSLAAALAFPELPKPKIK